jgi:hypothetical protein
MTPRIVAALALALLVTACEATVVPSLPPGAVHLLTWSSSASYSCYLLPHQGPMSVDPAYGTAFHEFGDPQGVPIAWPTGYTGRQAGAEVEVLDPTGKVRAATGRRLEVYLIDDMSMHVTLSEPAPHGAFFACG